MDAHGDVGPQLQCRLDSAHDLAALLAVLQLREKDQKDQRVWCEASSRGLKFTAQSNAKDVSVHAWMFSDAFREYSFWGQPQEIHLKLPVLPLLNCLQIFTERAKLVLRYPSGPSDELRFSLEEDGAVTECCIRTLVLDEGPAPTAFFAPGDPFCLLRPSQPEAWHQALSEFSDLDAPDVALQIALRSRGQNQGGLVIRAQTVTSDAEVEVPMDRFEELDVPQDISPSGEVVHKYHVTSVLASCMRAAKDAKAVKVRFNKSGVMSNQFILRGRGQKDLFCEALVCPLAEARSLGNVKRYQDVDDDFACNPYAGAPMPGMMQESTGF
jgi:hypothetical protein